MLKVTYIDCPGGPKERLIVTPLMDFVRQKRAAKIGSQVYDYYIYFLKVMHHTFCLYHQTDNNMHSRLADFILYLYFKCCLLDWSIFFSTKN